jgi:uncharacterized protein YecE (DUF72 family)
VTGDVYVGPAGWAYEDWKGIVYPRPEPRDFDPLRWIARYFDLVEVNSTFYRPPTLRAVESWARRVRDRDRFRFTVKVWREFTHGEAGAAGHDEAMSLAESLAPLADEDRLGALLLQFPFWFEDRPESRDRLSRLAEWFRGEIPVNVEIRHTSWIRREPMTFLHDLGLGFVNIDLPRARTSPPPTEFATTGTGYVRLHGRNEESWFDREAGRDQKYDYLYAGPELDEWVKRVRTVGGKTQVTYVVANNHFRGQAPANALQIMARIADRRVRLPRPLAEAYPGLLEDGDLDDASEGSLF